jgi:hypothetical protein
MAGRPQYVWPPSEQLLELAQGCVSTAELAQRLHAVTGMEGVSAEAVKSRIKKLGLNDQFAARTSAERRRRAVGTQPDGEEQAGPSREDVLQAENAELRQALTRHRKAAVADERLMLAMEGAIDRIRWRPLPLPEKAPKRPSRAHHRALLMLSDFHGGERVDRQVVNDLNEYDWEIQLARVEEVLKGVESHMRKMPALSGLDVGFIGDMCSGANHEEIKETNQFGMAEQGVKIAYLQAEILSRLAALAPDVRVFAVEGNHPRFERKPAAKNPHENMDWVAACFTREIVKRVGNISSFEIGRGSLLHTVAGRRCYVFHGDGVRSSMPGVPWGGIMRRTNTLQASYPFPIDHFLFGHWHQANVVQGGRIIGNGSLKGCDEWTLKNFGGGERPCQLLVTFDERAQRMTDVRYITPTAGLT